MKKALIIAALSLLSVFAFSQQPVVAVAPFDVLSGVSAEDAAMITDVFFVRLGNTRRVTLVNRSVVERVLHEHNFQTSDWSDKDKTAELGKALNANWIVQGNIRKTNNGILIIVQFYDIQNFRFEGGKDLLLANADEAYDKMTPFVNSLIQTISDTGGGNNPDRGGGQPPANMVRVEGGTFQMGTARGGERDERPVHTVRIKSFYMGKYEVTQKEWREVMGNNPSNFKGDNFPVENVSWFDAIEYCNELSKKEGLTPAYQISGNNITCDWNASGYRLPTEAEWEFAAKGGNGSPGNYTYSGSNSVDAVAWYDGNSGKTTQPVGTKTHNGLGIYDMSGNVLEWCWDFYGTYSSGTQTDPKGPGSVSDTYRVIRGGSWLNSAASVRSASRLISPPSYRMGLIGFRLVHN